MDDRLSVDMPKSPIAQLEEMDTQVELAGMDEEKTMFDPDTHPRDHYAADPDEPVCDHKGGMVDMMGDTPKVDNLTVDMSLGDDTLLDW